MSQVCAGKTLEQENFESLDRDPHTIDVIPSLVARLGVYSDVFLTLAVAKLSIKII